MSKSEFSRALKVTPTAVTLIEQGKTKKIKSETAEKLERATGFSSAWVVSGQGQKKRTAIKDDIDPGQLTRILDGLKGLSASHRRKIEADIDFFLSQTDD